MNVYLNVYSESSAPSPILNSYFLNNVIPLKEFSISEFDYVDLEIEADVYDKNIKLVIGSTPFLLDEPFWHSGKIFYRLNIDSVMKILPGTRDAHITSKYLDTKSGKRRFARLFINEIGLSKIYLVVEGEEHHVGSLTVQTSKISKENYELITEYLFSNGYFDSTIKYKVTLEGSQNSISYTLLEALRELSKKLKLWYDRLHYFSNDPITKTEKAKKIVSYNDSLLVDDCSLDWLIGNIETVSKAESRVKGYDFLVMNKPYLINTIQIEETTDSTNSYENRIIHGFILNLIKLILDFQDRFKSSKQSRTKTSTFKEFILDCFFEQVTLNLQKSQEYIGHIQLYFKKYLPVTNPTFGFPEKTDRFSTKNHYNEILKLIIFCRNIFSFDKKMNEFYLEINSFDKLFEVFCFYLIKDTIDSLIGVTQEAEGWKIESNLNVENHKSGVYTTNYGKKTITIYYECLPSEFRQFSKSKHSYNPDFVISIASGSSLSYIILDAKYKKYDRERMMDDLESLTFKYLHKIGIMPSENSKIVGLFTLSLADLNTYDSIFQDQYEMKGATPILPQIGNIGINPKFFKLEHNYIRTLVDFALKLT